MPYRDLLSGVFSRERLRYCRHHIYWRGRFRIQSLAMCRNLKSHQNAKPTVKLYLKIISLVHLKAIKKTEDQ